MSRIENVKNILSKVNFTNKGGLTAREFLLLVFLIIAVEGYLLYAWVLKPAYIQYDAAVVEKASRQTVLDGLISDYSRKANMEEQIRTLESEIAEVSKLIPAYVSQEEVILQLEELSLKNMVTIDATTFANISELPLEFVKTSDGSGISASSDAESSAVVTEQLVAINFECNYQELYSFLKDIESSLRKVSVKGIVLQRNEDDGFLSGLINLSFISYWDETQGPKPYTITTDEIPGKENPFLEFPGYSSTGTKSSSYDPEASTARPDFYLMINSYLNNSTKTMLMNYYNKGSEAAVDVNGIVKGNITINGKDGNYTFQYNFGHNSIAETSPTEVREGRIRMEVLVQPRRSADDKVGVMMDITNNSDVPFEITVKGDDAKNPRFVRGRTAGSVDVKQVE